MKTGCSVVTVLNPKVRCVLLEDLDGMQTDIIDRLLKCVLMQ